MNVPQHIVDLLEDYLDGALDSSGQEVLNAWLAESDSHVRAVAIWFKNQVELIETARVAGLCAVFEGLPFQASADPPQNKPQASSYRRLKAWFLQGAAAAAALAAIATVTIFWGSTWFSDLRVPSATAVALDEGPPPAILARLADCVWEANTRSLRVGQVIVAGTTLHLKAGLAQLIFESGATVVLMGPCKLQVENSMRCRLAHGSVSAEVPPRAAGFTIRGPSSEVIDLGTRFGFSVADAGKSEVHVFQGEVISRQLDAHGEVVGDDIRLRKNQAILFPGELKQAQRLAVNEAKFAQEVRPLWKSDNIDPLSVDRRLALWLRAEHGVLTDASQGVIAWQDLTMGDNFLTNDAFQPDPKSRPQLVLDGINGRPSIRFDGKVTSLTTTPITTTDNQTIVVVFEYLTTHERQKRIGGQVINYNGPPSRFLPDVHSPGVLQLGEKVAAWDGPPWSIAAKAFVGRDSRGVDVSAGVVVSDSLDLYRPRIATYVYNNAENRAALYVDGVAVAQASAPTSVAVTSRKVIGKHGIFDQWYFCGNLAELLIFNVALRPQEIQELSQQLMQRYGISGDAKPSDRKASVTMQ